MNRVLFSVGEGAILCSVRRPEYNGEYTIAKVLQTGSIHTCRLTGRGVIVSGIDFVYLLSTPLLSGLANGTECFICQSSLRKKYPPSTESFQEMMTKMLTKKGGIKHELD